MTCEHAGILSETYEENVVSRFKLTAMGDNVPKLF